MKILIKNCNLISMSENRAKFEKNIDILINENKIIKIQKNITEKVNKIIDAKDKIVMPGLINTHSHIPMSIFRETVDGLKTQEWLEKKIWPIEDKLTPKDIYWATMLSCIEMIKTGTTTINDMYFYTEEIINAALNTGIRLQTTRTLMGYNQQDEERILELKKIIEKYKNEDTISFNVGIHGLYTSNLEYVEKCVKFANDNNLIIHMHFCENEKERNEIIEQYNVNNPSEVIKENFKKIPNILAHSVKLSDNDIEILTKTNSFISHCPVSNLKLGCGVAPIDKMIKKGLCVSLGTDGQGSGSNLDMFETMKFTALLQKGINENPEKMPAYEVIKMATINGAKALQLDNEVGSIEEGKIADLILIDIKNSLSHPINDIFAQIVYNIKGYDVDTTIVNGNILMENKQVKNINIQQVIQECNKILNLI